MRPSRMSASETMHACRPKRLITCWSTSAPPKITSWRPAGRPGRCARSTTRSGPSTSHHRLTASAVSRSVVDTLPVVVDQAQLKAGQRGDRAGQADEPSRRTEIGQGRNCLLGVVQLGPNRLQRPRHFIGCRRVGAQEPLGEPHATDVERHGEDLAARLRDELRRSPSDVEDDHHLLARRAGLRSPRRKRAAPPRPPRAVLPAHR